MRQHQSIRHLMVLRASQPLQEVPRFRQQQRPWNRLTMEDIRRQERVWSQHQLLWTSPSTMGRQNLGYKLNYPLDHGNITTVVSVNFAQVCIHFSPIPHEISS